MSEARKALARQGGEATKLKHGIEHYKAMSKKGVAMRKYLKENGLEKVTPLTKEEKTELQSLREAHELANKAIRDNKSYPQAQIDQPAGY